MKRLALLLILLAGPALAQAADPVAALQREWRGLDAADTLAGTAHERAAQAATALAEAYRKAERDLAAAEAQKAALVEWLAEAQAQARAKEARLLKYCPP